jgi:hypothetical protein
MAEKKIIQKVNTKFDAWKQQLLHEISTKSPDEIYQHIKSSELKLDPTDLNKRKRINNLVSMDMRCIAKAANQEQCTRRKKDGESCCGTHCKGVPHGYINADSVKTYQKEVMREEINGILQYIDATGNVYKMEDVLKHLVNPQVIATWTKENGIYTIHPL